MLVATKLAAAALASSFAGVAAPATSSMPPMIVNVTFAANVSPALVTRLLAETDAVWRAGGVTFVWRVMPSDPGPAARVTEAGPYMATTLHVVIGNDTGVTLGQQDRIQLGWIVFDDEHAPGQQIYLSYENAERYLVASREVVGLVAHMPMNQRHTLLGRVMGRALAHELGHYLLASKVHTRRGLMKATRTASDFFSIGRDGFEIDSAQRLAIAWRWRGDSLVVSR